MGINNKNKFSKEIHAYIKTLQLGKIVHTVHIRSMVYNNPQF